MKKHIIFFTALLSFGLNATSNNDNDFALHFTENKGQISDENDRSRTDILFAGNTQSMNYFLRQEGISYQLKRIDTWKEEEIFKSKQKIKRADQITFLRLDLNWVGINTNSKIQTDETFSGYNNYYLPVCPGGIRNVKSYRGVTYEGIYNNVDLHYYSKNGALKYDFIVFPGGDYKKIQLEVVGADQIVLQKDGSIMLKTSIGNVIEGAPVVYQNNKQLNSKWKINSNILSFEIENYDPRYKLIIDPVTRLWGTYYGGVDTDFGNFTATDKQGNVYMCGGTNGPTSNLAIATFGTHQLLFGGGGKDAFLTKFNSAGIRQWGTYFGEGGTDEALGCCTDNSGNIYIAGYTTTNSGTWIATAGSHQSTHGGGTGRDAFLAKFDQNGVRIWGTYYGGNDSDEGYSCAADSLDNVYLCGRASSASNISTPSSHQSVSGSPGFDDGFLVKFNSGGVRQWGTYYGGTLGDIGTSCFVSLGGNVYLGGLTSSTTGSIFATPGAFQTNYQGAGDGFLAKFDPNGNRLWGTFYGSTAIEEVWGCSGDGSGNIFLYGYGDTDGNTSLATAGAHQVNHAGTFDCFLAKFNSTGSRIWGTYYGGTGGEFGFGCASDKAGNIYISGWTDTPSGSAIASSPTHQSVLGGGTDAFIAKFNASGIRQWGSYYGGTGVSSSRGCGVDTLGAVYLSGWTNSPGTTNAIATSVSHQNTMGGGMYDGFLVKFSDCAAGFSPLVSSSSSVICQTSSATLTAIGANSYSWSTGSNNTNIIVTPTSTTVYTVTMSDGNSCLVALSITQSVSPCTVIEENENSFDVRVFPNPVLQILNIEIKNEASTNIQIFNSLGQIVSSQKINSGKTELQLTNYSPGIYYLKINKGIECQVIKFIKQ